MIGNQASKQSKKSKMIDKCVYIQVDMRVLNSATLRNPNIHFLHLNNQKSHLEDGISQKENLLSINNVNHHNITKKHGNQPYPNLRILRGDIVTNKTTTVRRKGLTLKGKNLVQDQ